MPDIITTFEAVLRLAAEQLYAETVTAGSVPATGPEPGAAVNDSIGRGATEAAATGVRQHLHGCSNLLGLMCCLSVSGDSMIPHRPSPLALLARAARPGSQVQQQLYSLLATMMKISGCSKGGLGDTTRLRYCAAATYAASMLLKRAVRQQQQEHVGAMAAAGPPGSSSSHAAVVSMLPSMFIVGCCCMLRAEQLLGEQSPVSMEQQQQESCNSQGRQQQQQQSTSHDGEEFKFDVTADLLRVQQWLAAGSTCENLIAAGYAPLSVPLQRLQQLQQLHATLQTLQHSSPDTAALSVAAQQLKSAGVSLCLFALPCMCNNPGCPSVSGLSELASVSGRSCICGGCHVARYCGRACQRTAWKQHKALCAVLSAAAASGGHAGTAAAPAAIPKLSTV